MERDEQEPLLRKQAKKRIRKQRRSNQLALAPSPGQKCTACALQDPLVGKLEEAYGLKRFRCPLARKHRIDPEGLSDLG